MATSAIAGYNAECYVSSDGGSTYTKVGELTEVTITVEAEAIEATSHASGGWREYIGGLKQWTASAAYLYISTDAPQDAVYTALVDGTTIKFRFYPVNTAGTEKFEGSGTITSWELTGPLDEAAAVSIEIQGTGALTKGAIA